MLVDLEPSTNGSVVVRDRGRSFADMGLWRRTSTNPVLPGTEPSIDARGFLFLVGDPGFDDAIEVRGSASRWLAVLDRETRRLLCEQPGRASGLEVREGRVVWNGTSPLIGTDDEIVRQVDFVREMFDRLRDPGADTPGRLARNAAEDPWAAVRRANLLALSRAYPQSPEAMQATRAARSDADPGVRLFAATLCGAEGFPVLASLAVGAKAITLAMREEALRCLVRTAPRATALAVIDRVLENDAAHGRTDAVAACGRLRHRGAVPALLSRIEEGNPGIAAAAARALAEIGDPSAEPALIRMLGFDDTDAVVAAVESLGVLGTTAAVAPLLERGQGALTGPRIKLSVRVAVAAIQGRLRGAESGQLAITESAPTDGSLSIPEATGGETTLERE